MWPLEVMVPYWGQFIRSVVGRSQAALQEGKVEALRPFRVVLLKGQRGRHTLLLTVVPQEPTAEESALCPYSQKTLS